MATTTAPAAAGPPDPPPNPPTIPGPAPAADPADGAPAPGGRLAALFQAIDPVTAPTDPPAAAGGTADKSDKPHPADALDASTPGTTSESFKAPEDLAGKGSDAAGAAHKRSVWKAFGLAAAQRWAKGGGTRNKQLDLEKAKAQAHQVKEARTTTVMKSPGITPRSGGGNSGGNGGGKATGNSGKQTTGNGSTGGGRGGGGTGGGRGNSGSNGSNGSGGGGKGNGSTGNTGKNNSGGGGDKSTSGGGKGTAGGGGSGKTGSDGKAGKQGADGKAGGSGKAGSGTSGGDQGKSKSGDSKGSGSDTKGAGKDKGAGSKGDAGGSKAGKDGKGGGSGSSGSGGGKGAAGKDGHGAAGVDNRTPLEKSRDTGHGDGSAIRRGADHVKAYAKGVKDGWDDEKEKNGREHARLDKARDDQRKKNGAGGAGGAAGGKAGDPVDLTKKPDEKPAPLTAKDGAGRVVTITDKDGDDGVSTDVKPLKVKSIDTKTLTLGTDGSTTISRRELRNFAQYAKKLEEKENLLIKVQEACKALVSEAEQEAKECQDLAEQGKGVEGGEALVEKLNKLAEAAKNQAREAEELAKQAQRAAEMCKVVRTNINTRYEPLYKAVVDSKLTKPAEMRFYNDRGTYATAA